MFVEKGSSASVFRKAKRIFQRVSGAAVVAAGSFLAGDSLIVRAAEPLFDRTYLQCSGTEGLQDYLPWGRVLRIGVKEDPKGRNIYKIVEDYRYNSGQCETVLRRIPPELRPAMDLLASYPRTVQIARNLYSPDVGLVFSQEAADLMYDVEARHIKVNPKLKTASPQRLAAGLAHEGQHSIDRAKLKSNGTLEGCVELEVRAWDISSAFWGDLYGFSGKENPLDGMEIALNEYLRINRIDREVIYEAMYITYWEQCSRYPIGADQ